MSQPQMTVKCEECGSEMELDESWSSTSPPLPIIGKKVEYAEYQCPECRARTLFKREESTEDWQTESTRPFS